MDEFVIELMELCKKHGVKHDNLLTRETEFVESTDFLSTCDAHDPNSEKARTLKTEKIRILIKSHVMCPTFKKIERVPI